MVVPFESLSAVSYSHSIANRTVTLAVATQHTNVTGRRTDTTWWHEPRLCMHRAAKTHDCDVQSINFVDSASTHENGTESKQVNRCVPDGNSGVECQRQTVLCPRDSRRRSTLHQTRQFQQRTADDRCRCRRVIDLRTAYVQPWTIMLTLYSAQTIMGLPHGIIMKLVLWLLLGGLLHLVQLWGA